MERNFKVSPEKNSREQICRRSITVILSLNKDFNKDMENNPEILRESADRLLDEIEKGETMPQNPEPTWDSETGEDTANESRKGNWANFINTIKGNSQDPNASNANMTEVSADIKSFIREVCGSESAELVIEKTLTHEDVCLDPCHLLMPMTQVSSKNFLTDLENEKLINQQKVGVGVLVPPRREFSRLLLNIQRIENGQLNYILESGWRKVVEENGEIVKENAKVQLWSFRVKDNLCFVLVGQSRFDDNITSRVLLSEPIKHSTANQHWELSTEVRNFIREMGGSEVEFVIEKELTTTDLNPQQGRLSMPQQQLEKKDILTGKGAKKVRVFVPPRQDTYSLTLKRWNKNCVLTSGWNEVVKDSGLEMNAKVQLWSFRVQDEDEKILCFVIVRVVNAAATGGSNPDSPKSGITIQEPEG